MSKEMKCENCNAAFPAAEWLVIKTGGPMGLYHETFGSLASTFPLFCSEKCMREKRAADQRERAGH
jgi:hypothetical protein